MKKQVILDTDIGIDFDDTWALGSACSSDNFVMESHRLVIDDQGYMNDQNGGKLFNCAILGKI